MNLPEEKEEFSWLISCSKEDFETKYKQLHEKCRVSEKNYKSLQLRHVLLGEKSSKIAQREAILRNQVIILEKLHKDPGEAFQTLQTKYKEMQEELLIQANCIGELTRIAQQITIEADKNKVDLREKNATIQKLGEEKRLYKNEQITVFNEEKEKQSWKVIVKPESLTFDKEICELKQENKQIFDKLSKKIVENEELREIDIKHRRNVNLALDSMKILKSQLSSAGIIPISTPADDKFENKSTSPCPNSSYPMSPAPNAPVSPGPQAPVSKTSNTENTVFEAKFADLEEERNKNKSLSLEIKALNEKIVEENEIAKKNEEKAVNLIENKAQKYLEMLERNQKEQKERHDFDLGLITEKKNEILQLRNEIEEKKGKQEFDKGLIVEKNVEIGELRNEVEMRKMTSHQMKHSHKQFEDGKIMEIEKLKLDLKNLNTNNLQLIEKINKLETRLATKTGNVGIQQQVKIKELSAENIKLQLEMQNNRQKWQIQKENLRKLKTSIPNVKQFKEEISDYITNGKWALEKDILDIKRKLIDWSNIEIASVRIDLSDEIGDLQQKLSVAINQIELQADDFVQLKKEYRLAMKKIRYMERIETSEDKFNECEAKKPRK